MNASNEILTKEVLALRREVSTLIEMVNSLSSVSQMQASVVADLQQQAIGFEAAFQVFGEVLMASGPELRQRVKTSFSQILSRKDSDTNEHFRRVVLRMRDAAVAPSRTTPEGRRAGLTIVSKDDLKPTNE